MKRKSVILILVLLLIMVFTDVCFAADLGKVDAAGNRILLVVRRIGYWIILVKGLSDIIGQGMKGDVHAIGRTVMLYVILYGTLFFLPYALRLVEGVF